jgi:hypothetical protein
MLTPVDRHEPTLFGERLPVLFRDQASITADHEPAESDPRGHVADDVVHGTVVDAVTGPDVRHDRPARAS